MSLDRASAEWRASLGLHAIVYSIEGEENVIHRQDR